MITAPTAKNWIRVLPPESAFLRIKGFFVEQIQIPWWPYVQNRVADETLEVWEIAQELGN
jgi:hypothetical protein